MHFCNVAEEEIMFTGDKSIGIGLLNTKEHIAFFHIFSDGDTQIGIFAVRESASWRGLDEKIQVRIDRPEIANLERRKSHAVIYRRFSFFKNTNFHRLNIEKD